MARRHRMGMDGGDVMSRPPTPMEEEVIVILRDRGPMTLRDLEVALGRERHDKDVLKALRALKSCGIISRKGTHYDHRIIWELM